MHAFEIYSTPQPRQKFLSRHIKNLTCHMEIICFRQHLILRWQQCVNIHDQTIHCHIRIFFCLVVQNVHILIFRVNNNIGIIKMLAPPYGFMYINTLHVVLFITDTLSMKRNSVNCVRLIHIRLLPRTLIPEKIL